MAVNEGREVQRKTRKSTVRDDGGLVGRKADVDAQTRRVVAIVVSVTFSAIALLIVIGGMLGRFDQTLVGDVLAALVCAAGAIFAYLFYRSKAGGE
jgi:hypothetical protein